MSTRLADWECGYLAAVANMLHMHDNPTIAKDVAQEVGLLWSQVERAGLSEYDMDALLKIKDAFR